MPRIFNQHISERKQIDSKIRLMFLNNITHPLEEEVTKTWDALCKEIEQENVTALIKDNQRPEQECTVFTFRNSFYPTTKADTIKLSFLRRHALPLHKSLQEEFADLHKTFVIDYERFKGRFKHLLSALCRQANSVECFEDVLGEPLMRTVNKKELSYTPIPNVKPWSDGERQRFKEQHKSTIKKANYYASIRQLL